MGSPEIADVFVPVPVIELCDKRLSSSGARGLRRAYSAALTCADPVAIPTQSSA
jgi:hypothetical protein